MSQIAPKPHLLALLVVVVFPSVNAAFYTPGMPAIQGAFGRSAGDVQMTMTFFLVGYACAQLIYAPLANRFGRRPTLLMGVGAALVGNVMCALAGLSNVFDLLLWGRLVTAAGSAAGLAIGFTMINDAYEEGQARKIVAYVTVGFAAVPGIAVAVGAMLVEWLGWESAFYAMVFYSLFAGAVAYTLPETGSHFHADATRVSVVAMCYLEAFRNIHLLRYALMAGLCTAIGYCFSAAAPFIGIGRFQMEEWKYGIFFLLPAAALVGAALTSGWLSRTISATQIMRVGAAISLTGGVVLKGLFALDLANPWTFFLSVALTYVGCALIYVNAVALATRSSGNKAAASSAMSFIITGTAVFGVLLLGLIPAGIGALFPTLVVVMTALMGLLLIVGKEKRSEQLS